MCVFVFDNVCLNAQGDEKRTSDALYLELKDFCEVPGMDVGNQTAVLKIQ